ncbi:MAG: TetR family transcriptional regulator [Candidatus Rokubacteria bacterium]|nr:TetR family transcriptional regulator [Candidatus Rokubacteria bacterium]
MKAARSGPRHEVLRAGILTAAADLFRQRGYRAATLDEIARKVGVSKPTLYGYFRSKEELLAAIFHRTMSLFERDLEAIRASADDPPARLRRVIRFHVGAVIAERSFLAVFFGEEANLPPRLGRAIRRRKARYDRTVRAIVEAGVRDGSIRADNPRLLVFALLGMANWVYQWYDPAGAWDADTIAASFIALLEPGYVTTPRSRERAVTETLTRIERELARLRPLVGANVANGAVRRRARRVSGRALRP